MVVIVIARGIEIGNVTTVTGTVNVSVIEIENATETGSEIEKTATATGSEIGKTATVTVTGEEVSALIHGPVLALLTGLDPGTRVLGRAHHRLIGIGLVPIRLIDTTVTAVLQLLRALRGNAERMMVRKIRTVSGLLWFPSLLMGLRKSKRRNRRIVVRERTQQKGVKKTMTTITMR